MPPKPKKSHHHEGTPSADGGAASAVPVEPVEPLGDGDRKMASSLLLEGGGAGVGGSDLTSAPSEDPESVAEAGESIGLATTCSGNQDTSSSSSSSSSSSISIGGRVEQSESETENVATTAAVSAFAARTTTTSSTSLASNITGSSRSRRSSRSSFTSTSRSSGPGAYAVSGPGLRALPLREMEAPAPTLLRRTTDTVDTDTEAGTAAATSPAHHADYHVATAALVVDDRLVTATLVEEGSDGEGGGNSDSGDKLLLESDKKRKRRIMSGAVLVLVVVLVVALVVALAGKPSRNGGSGGSGSSSGAEKSTNGNGHTGDIGSQCPSNKLVSQFSREEDNFGYALAASNGTVLVGALRVNVYGEDSGEAYVWVRKKAKQKQQQQGGDEGQDEGQGQDVHEWEEEAVLRPNPGDGFAGDKFGVHVAIDGDTAVVSADQANGAKGAVFVFVRTYSTKSDSTVEDGSSRSNVQWVQQAKLVANDAVENIQFGDSVAVKGDTIAVGAPSPDDVTGVPAAVYVFTRTVDANGTKWEQQTKIVPDSNEARRFGRSVALGNDMLVVGDDCDVTNGERSGAASIYSRQPSTNESDVASWTLQAKVTPNDGGEFRYFGFGVDIDASGDTVIVGQWKDGELVQPATAERSGKTSQIGSVYVFSRQKKESASWKQEAKIAAGDGEAKDRFGSGVSINDEGNSLLIGAYQDDERTGSAYLFTRSSKEGAWEQQKKLRAENVFANDLFGYRVALDGSVAFVSEHGDGANGYGSGAVHAIDLVESCLL